MVEKLKYEDGTYADVIIDRFNELVDALEALNERVDNVWAYLRHKHNEEKRKTILEGRRPKEDENGNKGSSKNSGRVEEGKQIPEVDKR